MTITSTSITAPQNYVLNVDETMTLDPAVVLTVTGIDKALCQAKWAITQYATTEDDSSTELTALDAYMSMDTATYVVSVAAMTDSALALNSVWEATSGSPPDGFTFTYKMTFKVTDHTGAVILTENIKMMIKDPCERTGGVQYSLSAATLAGHNSDWGNYLYYGLDGDSHTESWTWERTWAEYATADAAR